MSAFDEVFDVVVVGSGGGSMCAGLLMRTQGKTALILEKTDVIGGATARSGGVMWIPNNRFMKRDGIDDSLEKATTYLNNVVGSPNDAPGASPDRRNAYLTEAPRMIDFLVEQGIKLTRASYWPDYYDDRPGGSKEGRTVIAELFNVNELGSWKSKLRPGMMATAGAPRLRRRRHEAAQPEGLLGGQVDDAEDRLADHRGEAHRQALCDRRRGVAGAHVAGVSEGRRRDPDRLAGRGVDRRGRCGEGRPHRQGRPPLAGRRAPRRPGQRRRLRPQPADA
jgi:hypothetical protein